MTDIETGAPEMRNSRSNLDLKELVQAAFDNPGVWVSIESDEAARRSTSVHRRVSEQVAEVLTRRGRIYVKVKE